MTNKKDLKRSINNICNALFAECVAVSLYSGKADKADAEALLSSIIAINNDFVTRVSHPEPGMTPKAYYKTLVDEFSKHVAEIADQISNL